MLEAIREVLTYVAIPVLIIAVAGSVSVFYSPGPGFRHAVQHIAAGLVFAAVSTGLLTEILKARDLVPTIVGFTVGVVAMVGMKWYVERGGHSGFAYEDAPLSLVITAGIDYIVDGLLIGIGFGIGARAGGLLTFALTIEGLFLAVAVVSTLSRTSLKRSLLIAISCGLGLLFLLGAIAGAALYDVVSGPIHTALIAFGAAALIYLVTEELLVEAHNPKTTENPLTAALFFVGFLLLLGIELSV
jgi:zinc transporter, ZIP family